MNDFLNCVIFCCQNQPFPGRNGCLHIGRRTNPILIELNTILKGNMQFTKKVTFEFFMDYKKNHYGGWKYYTSCYF